MPRITIAQAAARHGVSKQTIYRKLQKGQLTSYDGEGTGALVDTDELDALYAVEHEPASDPVTAEAQHSQPLALTDLSEPDDDSDVDDDAASVPSMGWMSEEEPDVEEDEPLDAPFDTDAPLDTGVGLTITPIAGVDVPAYAAELAEEAAAGEVLDARPDPVQPAPDWAVPIKPEDLPAYIAKISAGMPPRPGAVSPHPAPEPADVPSDDAAVDTTEHGPVGDEPVAVAAAVGCEPAATVTPIRPSVQLRAVPHPDDLDAAYAAAMRAPRLPRLFARR